MGEINTRSTFLDTLYEPLPILNEKFEYDQSTGKIITGRT